MVLERSKLIASTSEKVGWFLVGWLVRPKKVICAFRVIEMLSSKCMEIHKMQIERSKLIASTSEKVGWFLRGPSS